MKAIDTNKSLLDVGASPAECPFREFRDSELSTDFWGLGPVAFKSAVRLGKGAPKLQGDQAWVDDQIQPLPRSARRRFHNWVRPEELAKALWEAEINVFDDNIGGKMSPADIQLSHYQVLQMSSFCRHVLSVCYILERAEDFTVEHQWENFLFNIPPDGWRARYHIYSPGLKHGGGQQHRPTLSKNGCYLVRLYYVGAWRCVWVSDQVPIDANESPLLPFAPSFSQNSIKPEKGKQAAATATAPPVNLWPLLICKALLKLAAPRMDSVDQPDNFEDERFDDFDIMHALTGAMTLNIIIGDADRLWKRISSEVPQFVWDDDDETITSAVKTKAKKPSNKDVFIFKHRSLATILIQDTRDLPPYTLPGITPAFEMQLLVVMTRDLPLKKPLPEPEVAPWKHYRWVDWARKHGLYEAYDCPRTRFLKMNGLLKLSLAPHLLDIQSTDSITFFFREEHGKTNATVKKSAKAVNRSTTTNQTLTPQIKEEMRDWVQFDAVQKLMKRASFLYYPSMYQFCSIASNPTYKITKSAPNKEIDVPASKTAPLYLQIDGPEMNCLRISCGLLHPRVLLHAGVPMEDYIEPGYVLVEKFDWFADCETPKPKTYIQTRGYDATEVSFQPGRHFCRLWIHSRMPWHVMLLSDSTIHVGTCDVIQIAAMRECPWASRFLNALGAAFQNFMRTNKSNTAVLHPDREFYKSYQPDLEWNPKVVGYSKNHLHWMFRQALQSLLKKRLTPFDYKLACKTLQNYFLDPQFGLLKKATSFVSAKDLILNDPCFCPTQDTEELEILRMNYTEMVVRGTSDTDLSPSKNLLPRVCEAATKKFPCGTLKTWKDIIISRHKAATCLQALWRGIRARKCVETRATVAPEVLKCLMDNAFGNLEALSALMNEFFEMFPGTKSAFSVASALTGSSGLKQYFGITHMTPRCVWIPLFQGEFYCHAPVKVHLTLQCTIGTNKLNSIVEVYDNDSKEQLSQAYTAHMTLNLSPNSEGYSVIGHATLQQASITVSEVHWELYVMSSAANVFHICDNELDGCKELPMLSATKLHVDEIFVPNENNILGGIQITVSRQESICFRASATSEDLEMVAVLQTTTSDGNVKEIERRYGIGELYWPYMRLKPISSGHRLKSISQADMATPVSEPIISGIRSQRTIRHGKPMSLSAGIKTRSAVKIGVTKEKEKMDTLSLNQLQPGDAYVELECSLGGASGAIAKRDDKRDFRFAAAVKSWEANELGRNVKGALIRQEFRNEYVESVMTSKVQFVERNSVEVTENAVMKENLNDHSRNQQGLTPTESVDIQVVHENSKAKYLEQEFENNIRYISMPEELKDKFRPLTFVSSCMKEKTEDECVILTSEMMEAAKMNREADIETAYERMKQIQTYNDIHVLGAQKTRCDLLETLFVDSQWSPGLKEALEVKNNKSATETLNKSVSVMRKKQDTKTK